MALRAPSLVTGEGVPVELPYASVPSRLLAAGIDFALSTAAFLLAGAGLTALLGQDLDQALARALLLLLLVMAYLLVPATLTATTGRTPGKWVMGLRVTRDDGAPVDWREAFGRDLVGFVVEKPGPLLGLPALLCMLAREDSKRIGDLISGTVVLSTRVARAGIGHQVQMPPQLAAWATTLDLSHLRDPLAQRAHELLTRERMLTTDAQLHLLRQLEPEMALAVGPRPPQVPLRPWLAAILAERRRRDVARLQGQSVPVGFGLAAWDR